MKIISCLGTGKYSLTTYLHPSKSQSKETCFFQEALVEFYHPEILYVLLTPTVVNHPNWAELQRCLEGKVKLQPIYDIPERNSTEDIWLIFERVAQCCEPNDHVIFDITHGFRSIPIIALLSVSYLRTVKNVTIEAIFYGAIEAKNKEVNETPTFDLLPVVKLLDWITAVDRFTETGDGQPLVNLLTSAINPELQESDLAFKQAQNKLDNVADKIQQVSQALALARPKETLNASKTIEKSLYKAHESIAKYAKPFDLVKDKVLAGYGQFALTDKNDLSESLWSQFKMINWFMERNQVMQAMTLAREWVISLLAYRLGERDLLNKECRKETENALHNGKAKLKGDEPESASRFDEGFASLPEYEKLSDIWNTLTDIRNDIAHVGMRKGEATVKNLRTRSQAILPELQAIANTFLQSNPE